MIARLALALLAPLALVGCVLTPGKFVSTLRIDADRNFAFEYKGEVIAVDPSTEMKMSATKPADGDKADVKTEVAPTEDTEAKHRAMAETLAKEAGYRSVVYRGKGKFEIDYAMAGTLSHGFVFPYNSDAEAVFPFLAIEVRQGGLVRVKAPGFAAGRSNAAAAGGGMGMPSTDTAKYLDGSFTLDTDAEIVSQNNEDGAVPAGKRRSIRWRVTPLSKDAPTAVLRLRS